MSLSTVFNTWTSSIPSAWNPVSYFTTVKPASIPGIGKDFYGDLDLPSLDLTARDLVRKELVARAVAKKTPAWIPAFLVMVGLPANAVGPDYDPENMPPNSTNTRNELENDFKKGICPPATFLYARGTVEAGNMGQIVGPAMEDALKQQKVNIAIQGINYKTTQLQGGFLTGVQQMVSLAEQTATKCPKTKIVLGGYSQGGWLMHIAIGRMNTQTLHRIAAVIAWGNPDFFMSGHPDYIKKREKTFCRRQDIVCFGLGTEPGTHVSYGGYNGAKDSTPEAVQFIKKNLATLN